MSKVRLQLEVIVNGLAHYVMGLKSLVAGNTSRSIVYFKELLFIGVWRFINIPSSGSVRSHAKTCVRKFEIFYPQGTVVNVFVPLKFCIL